MNNNDQRLQALTHWCQTTIANQHILLKPLTNDASFRRYFRVYNDKDTWIAIDAPPSTEKNAAYIAIANTLNKYGLHAPKILASDLEQGFILTSDLGDTLLSKALTKDTVYPLYQNAMQALIKLQQCPAIDDYSLPHFDAEFISREFSVFKEWFLKRYLNLNITLEQLAMLEHTLALLIDNVRAQPQVLIHLDYHSRNLMLLKDNTIGLLDFQDAAIGPISYDLVSLLKDCYVDWPIQDVQIWALQFYQSLPHAEFSFLEFIKWFDLTGLQRHLKVLGIFTRLHLRDHKSLYLNDIPRIMDYIKYVLNRYPELALFKIYFNDIIVPRYQEVSS